MAASVTKFLDDIRTEVMKYPVTRQYATMLEENTKVNVEYFIVGLLALLAIGIFSGYGAHFISSIVGFVYPVYATLKAIETTKKDDDTEWLTYWVVFAVFSLLENFTSILLYWVPFYYALKTTFLVWCMVPQFKGAKTVYEIVIKPIHGKYEGAIDSALNSVSGKATKD